MSVCNLNVKLYAEIPSFTIVTEAVNGTVTGAGTYLYGTEVILTAEANEGYEFDGWSDGSIENPRTIIVTEDATYTAEFKIIESGVENIQTEGSKAVKYIENGHVYILRDGVIYTITGQRVK